MKNTKAILEPDCLYHIYNRANGSEQLFLEDEHYRFFLEKFRRYILPVAEVWAYCLMPNHFHFLVRVKSISQIEDVILQGPMSSKTLQGFRTLEGLAREKSLSTFLSQQFSHMLNGYSQAFNKQQGRKGSLFMHPFKRIQVTDEKYLIKLIHYIHYNPVESGLAEMPEDWKFSSFVPMVSQKPTLVQRTAVVKLFGDIENFIYCHRYPPQLTGLEDF